MGKAEEASSDVFQKEGAEADALEELAGQEGVVTMEAGSEGNKTDIHLEDFSQEFRKLTYLGKEGKISENATGKAGKLCTSSKEDKKSRSSLELITLNSKLQLNTL